MLAHGLAWKEKHSKDDTAVSGSGWEVESGVSFHVSSWEVMSGSG